MRTKWFIIRWLEGFLIAMLVLMINLRRLFIPLLFVFFHLFAFLNKSEIFIRCFFRDNEIYIKVQGRLKNVS